MDFNLYWIKGALLFVLVSGYVCYSAFEFTLNSAIVSSNWSLIYMQCDVISAYQQRKIFTTSTATMQTHNYKKAQLSLTNPRDAKACQNCFNSACLQRCRWQYWPSFISLTAIASEIQEIQRNSLKIPTYGVQGHPRSPILVPIESPYVTCY